MGPTADLLRVIIDAVTDDAALAQVPAAIAQMLGTVLTPITVHGAQGVKVLTVHGADPRLQDLYEKHYWTVDPWLAAYERGEVSGVAASDSYISEDRMLRSELYNDLLKYNDDMIRCLSFAADVGEGERLLFSAQRARKKSLFEPHEVKLAETLPPLLMSLVVGRRRLAAGRGRLAERVVDTDADAAMVLAADGRIAFANAAARRLFETGPLRAVEGRLAAANPDLARALAQAVKAACAGLGGRVVASPDGVWRVAIDPLEGAAAGPGGGGGPPLALVRVRDEAARRGATLAIAAEALGLTPAERALADALLAGRTPADHAHARGVSIATARTQMRALLAKAGAARQAELVVRLKAFAP